MPGGVDCCTCGQLRCQWVAAECHAGSRSIADAIAERTRLARTLHARDSTAVDLTGRIAGLALTGWHAGICFTVDVACRAESESTWDDKEGCHQSTV